MLDKFYYQNNFGEILHFGKNGLYASYNDLRDYEWDYTENNGLISDFSMKIINKELPVLFASSSGQATKQLRNKAYSIVEKDVRAGLRGRLYVGNYYLECNIYGMKNSDYLIKDYFLRTSMKVVTDSPMWKRSTLYSFVIQDEDEAELGTDYPFDYPTDFLKKEQGQQIIANNSDFATDFIMTIYGAATAPEILINNHSYKMNCSILSGEKIVIDSSAKTIFKHSGGTAYNAFNDRAKANSVFEKIPNGKCTVDWNNTFDFDIILIDSRAEPLWTWTDVNLIEAADAAKVGNTYYLIDSRGKYIRDNDNEPIAVQTGGDDE